MGDNAIKRSRSANQLYTKVDPDSSKTRGCCDEDVGVLYGAGAPDNTEGSNGYFYLNTDDGSWYRRSGGAWTQILNPVGLGGIYAGSGEVPANTIATLAGDVSFTRTSGNKTFQIYSDDNFFGAGDTIVGLVSTNPDAALESTGYVLAGSAPNALGVNNVVGTVITNSEDSLAGNILTFTDSDANPYINAFIETSGTRNANIRFESLSENGDGAVRITSETTGTGQPSIQFISTRGATGGNPVVEMTIDDNGTENDWKIQAEGAILSSGGTDKMTIPWDIGDATYANDAAASGGGVAVGSIYVNSSTGALTMRLV